VWGTYLARKHFAQTLHLPAQQEPISILKPIKGSEADLSENLESFFRIEYPRFEILLSIANPEDSAVQEVNALIAKYPRVRARLLLGEVVVGANPKVNNLMKSYSQARHDWILISDSNTRVKPDYLKKLSVYMGNDVGVVTAVVRGTEPSSPGGYLEAAFLNTFYARWMILARSFGQNVVVGKSMLFRRSAAARFGGIPQLARYLAEDYMAGQAMQMLGLKVLIQDQPIAQPLSYYTYRNFWSRHLRWGRIRKAQAPGPFWFEPFLSTLAASVLGGFAFAQILSGLEWYQWTLIHLGVFAFFDMQVLRAVGEKVSLRYLLAWLTRECLAIPQWIHIASGHTVDWRGRKLRIERGGTVHLT
jgi:ceramide glucosyltransferase